MQTLPDPKNTKTHIVKAAWFWFTIQNGYAYEMEYLFSDVSIDLKIFKIFAATEFQYSFWRIFLEFRALRQNLNSNDLIFLFLQYLDSIAQTPGSTGDGERRDSLINYSSKAHRKRKRLSRIAVHDGTPVSTGKRRSSVSDAGLLSMSGSFIDCTASPDKHDTSKLNGEIIL